ncbi:MarR family transcriptional regulator [Streptomyces sp. DG2A-72]|uniref:MarR family winged helix-turn-helix transcriptional regulator n=1 Tax=Streptomyces sp. DG2A-72 TaxID=3051386 RepID=UPI00265C2F52|nr:MarR family transcriptional regulator [Streptomyces sp. DG2A-72]MDO0939384.1 MarR family transcriptional regulator [Streptomyces sp. DG2A-72]
MTAEPARWRQQIILTWRVGNAVDRALLRRHGIGLSDFLTLSALKDAGGGPLRVMELADAVGVSSSTMSRMLSRLETDALVARRVGTDDRRSSYAELTRPGAEKLGSATATFALEVAAALATAP